MMACSVSPGVKREFAKDAPVVEVAVDDDGTEWIEL
jgi:hypothetical protein